MFTESSIFHGSNIPGIISTFEDIVTIRSTDPADVGGGWTKFPDDEHGENGIGEGNPTEAHRQDDHRPEGGAARKNGEGR